MLDRSEATRGNYHHGDLRQALLKAAEEELEEKGIEHFTLRGCAKRAGVSHAAPAHHFKDANALLTALAAIGFTRFGEAMEARRRKAGSDPADQLVALGLAYIDFAVAEPALFRLMFASNRPDFSERALEKAGAEAYGALLGAVGAVRGGDPCADPAGIEDISACWAMVHGISDLILSGRMKWLGDLDPKGRDAVCARLIRRVVPTAKR